VLKIEWTPDGLCFLVDEAGNRWAEVLQFEEDGTPEDSAEIAAERAGRLVAAYNKVNQGYLRD
jgi:hypothetical protein